MRIKQKLLLGIGILFAMILLLMTLSITYINRVKFDTKNILVANYHTLNYARKMQIALDNDLSKPENLKLFQQNLSLQQKNITEAGEQQLTDSLTLYFNLLNKSTADTTLLKKVRKSISDIMLMNMLAIERKSNIAETTADQSIFWITIAGTICFLIALILLFNLPGNIANPIKELTESIKEIANGNYSRRIHFQKNNEFGELAASFNTMAEKLEEYQLSNLQKLLIEKKRIETLINNMHDPVIGLDEKNQVLFMNDVALKITGLKKEDVVGKPIQDIAVQNDLIRSLVKDLLRKKGISSSASSEPIKIYADNKESFFEKEIIPIKIIPTGEKEEKLLGNVILLQNVTPYKELDAAKTNFIATVSHELKTPISSIQMSLQLLQNTQVGTLNEEQKNLTESMKEDANRLLKITGELLNMTQVETGTIQMFTTSASPKEIVDEVINVNKTLADSKNIKLEVILPESLPDVVADKEKTAWVLSNLVSNAIRYSYDNSTVYIDVKEEDKKIRFSVTDTGRGIEPEYIDKIFDRYFRIPGTKKEGTGLGLSISKEFIEAQGGTITVESELASGSTFAITLPAAK